jgi:hypothetical protein
METLTLQVRVSVLTSGNVTAFPVFMQSLN